MYRVSNDPFTPKSQRGDAFSPVTYADQGNTLLVEADGPEQAAKLAIESGQFSPTARILVQPVTVVELVPTSQAAE